MKCILIGLNDSKARKIAMQKIEAHRLKWRKNKEFLVQTQLCQANDVFNKQLQIVSKFVIFFGLLLLISVSSTMHFALKSNFQA